jgi:GMP synthase (glutamine-hydrolysing)
MVGMNKQEIGDTERRVLVVNAMVDAGLADSFDGAIRRPLKKAGVDYALRRLLDCQRLEEEAPFSHLIISGSEASVMEERAENELLLKIVRDFVDREQRVLGICYGHQFLAANLYRKDCCRKSKTPEFGWTEIKTQANPLFGDVRNPFCMVSHYDEVFDLDDTFDVIASTERCGVHGFQYRNLPVWGLQFHPEYNDIEAAEIFSLLIEQDPGTTDYFSQHKRQPIPWDLMRNESIISGFCRI